MDKNGRENFRPEISLNKERNRAHMIKRAAAAVLGIFLAVSLAGCSNNLKLKLPFFSGDPKPDYESGTTEEEFHGITYQIPSSWKSQQSEDGNIVYYFPESEQEDMPVSILLQYSYMDEELWEDGEEALLHSLASDYESLEGIRDFKQEDSSLGSIPTVKITCTQTMGEEEEDYAARYVLIPVNREAVLIAASAVPEKADNSYEADFEHICESIEIPQ